MPSKAYREVVYRKGRRLSALAAALAAMRHAVATQNCRSPRPPQIATKQSGTDTWNRHWEPTSPSAPPQGRLTRSSPPPHEWSRVATPISITAATVATAATSTAVAAANICCHRHHRYPVTVRKCKLRSKRRYHHHVDAQLLAVPRMEPRCDAHKHHHRLCRHRRRRRHRHRRRRRQQMLPPPPQVPRHRP